MGLLGPPSFLPDRSYSVSRLRCVGGAHVLHPIYDRSELGGAGPHLERVVIWGCWVFVLVLDLRFVGLVHLCGGRLTPRSF